MNKNLGILCAVSSLPSNHGIGDFGDSCYKLINWLVKNRYKYWQVLPINPVGPGYSPYMSTCSNAIEYRYISLDYLVKEGLLDKVPNFQKTSKSVDYFSVGEFKKKYLYKAYKNYLINHYEALHKFKVRNPWVMTYATFEVFKWHNDNQQWTKWRIEDRDYFLSHNNPPKHYLDEINFVIFMQLMALKQWKHVLSYAKRKHIKVICDMPFYVGFDGVECWLNRDLFSIDKKTCELYEVGGVGPDGFSVDGQLWGTPIYNFDKMKLDDYKLLTDRIGYLTNLCDILRIDHFRAFDTYYVIPAGEETAKNGVWKIGPRDDFFNCLYKKYPHTDLIAEDLGELRPEVLELRDQFNFPGMYIVQFTIFDFNQKSTVNQIVYPGTHDNETLYGWYLSLREDQLQMIENRVGCHNRKKLYDELVKYTYSIPSKMTIVPIQDILKLDNEARMNYPGTVGDPNWKWKLNSFSWVNKVKYPFKKWRKE